MISKDTEPYLQEIIKNGVEKVFFANWIEKMNRHQNIQKRLLVFSDIGIYICHPKAFSKISQKKTSYSWFDIVSIELIEPKTIIFSFRSTNDTLSHKKVISDVPYAIIDFVGQQIVNIENPQEYPQFVVPHFSYLKYPISIFSGLYRLKAKILYDNAPNKQIMSLLELYTLFLNSGSNIFNFGMFGENQYNRLILDSLCVVPNVNTVVFPSSKSSPSHWADFFYLLEHSIYVSNVITHEKIDPNFDLIQKVTSSTFSGVIASITFGCPHISNRELSMIRRLYQSCKIPEIVFSQSQFQVNHFKIAPHFVSTSSFFTSLTFDQMPLCNISSIIQSLVNVKHISLTLCHLDLGIVLPLICSLKECQIQSINLSGNFCQKMPKNDNSIKNLLLPDSIDEIIVDDFIFYGNSARDFLSFIINQRQKEKFSISMKKMSIEKENWKPLFKYMLKHSQKDPFFYPITKFVWDGNEMNYSLFTFLNRCKNLKVLSLNGCFNNTDNSLIQYLLSFITCTRSCIELNIGGSVRHRFPTNILESIILTFKADQRVIKKINISGHNYRPETLNLLADTLLANRVIEWIDFSTNGILKKENWSLFFRKLVSRGKSVDFPIPQNELGEMIRTKTLSHEELEDFTNLMNLIKRRNSQTNLPPDSIYSPLGQFENKEEEKEKEFVVETHQVLAAADDLIELVVKDESSITSLITQLKSSSS